MAFVEPECKQLLGMVIFNHGQHSGAVDSALSPHSKKVLGLNPSQDVSVWSLHVLPVLACVYSGYSGFLPQSKNM